MPSEIVELVRNYIVNHNLLSGCIINPDKKLNELLNVPEGSLLTIFNIYPYLSCHFMSLYDENNELIVL